MVSVLRLCGVLAVLGLVALPLTTASPPILGDTGLVEPRPVHTVTLPGPVSAGSYVYFDDYSWCEAPPCQWSDGPHVSTRMNGASGFVAINEEAWQIVEGGREGTAALAFTDPGWSLGVPEFSIGIRPHTPFASLGSNLEVSVVATPHTSLLLHEGGLRLEMMFWDEHMQQLSGPHDCLIVPGPTVGDGFHELLPANPLCRNVPLTTKIELRFTVQEGVLGGVPDVAIDTIVIDRV